MKKIFTLLFLASSVLAVPAQNEVASLAATCGADVDYVKSGKPVAFVTPSNSGSYAENTYFYYSGSTADTEFDFQNAFVLEASGEGYKVVRIEDEAEAPYMACNATSGFFGMNYNLAWTDEASEAQVFDIIEPEVFAQENHIEGVEASQCIRLGFDPNGGGYYFMGFQGASFMKTGDSKTFLVPLNAGHLYFNTVLSAEQREHPNAIAALEAYDANPSVETLKALAEIDFTYSAIHDIVAGYGVDAAFVKNGSPVAFVTPSNAGSFAENVYFYYSGSTQDTEFDLQNAFVLEEADGGYKVVRIEDEAEAPYMACNATSGFFGMNYNLAWTDEASEAQTFNVIEPEEYQQTNHFADVAATSCIRLAFNPGSGDYFMGFHGATFVKSGDSKTYLLPLDAGKLYYENVLTAVQQANAAEAYAAYQANPTMATLLAVKAAKDQTPTCISNVNTESDNCMYDLMGRRITTPVKGQIVVKNGKKLIAE